jgi:hypothetical protein
MPTNRPNIVTGKSYPYPTVNVVTIASHTAFYKLLRGGLILY